MIQCRVGDGVRSGLHLELFPPYFQPQTCMTPTHSQAVLTISLPWIIVLFKLSCQHLRQEPRGSEEPVSRQLLKPLHRGRCLRMFKFKPPKHFPTLGGFCLDSPEKWSFPISTISPSPGMPGGSDHSHSIISYSLGKNSGDYFHGTFCLIHWGHAEEGQRGELTLWMHRLWANRMMWR